MDSCLLDDIRDVAFYLKKKLGETEIKNYPEVPKQFSSYLLGVINDILNYLDTPKLREISLKRTGLLLSYLNSLLEYLDHADIDEIPIDLVEIFEDILKEYDKKSSMYIIGSYDYNYSYIDILGFLKDILDKSRISRIAVDKKIGVIAFPISQKDNLLLNSVLSHEMGHFIDDILGIQESIAIDTNPDLIDELVESALKEAHEIKAGEEEAVTLDVFIQRDFLKANYSAFFSKILNAWVKEFIADAIAIYLFGPAYFFSFICLSESVFDEYRYSDDHPPLFLRMIPIYNTLKELKYINHLSNYDQIKEKLEKYAEMIDKHLPSEDKKGKILEDASRRAIPDILQEVKSNTNNYFSNTIFNREIEVLRESIKNFIPPNEILNDDNTSFPSHPLSIINVGWIARLVDIDELYRKLGAESEQDRFDIRFTLNKLLSKALESRSIHHKIRKGIIKDD